MVTRETSNWRLLDLSYSTAFENLALEEALARTTGSVEFQPTIRFWTNPPSVVLGRFQRASDEVDSRVCDQYGVQIARRFTGGGAVFHDKGNLNFTIVIRRDGEISPSKLQDDGSSIVVEALRRLGVKATFLSPNSILIGNQKVSGCASAIGRNFALWHDSILVSSNIATLERVLAPSRRINSTPFVRSHWQPVTNLEAVLCKSISLDYVKLQLLNSLRAALSVELTVGGLNSDEEAKFGLLYDEKYSSIGWNLNGTCKEI